MSTLDLDAIEVPKLSIKLNGEEILLNPPSAYDILKMSNMALELGDPEIQKDEKKAMEALSAIGDIVYKHNPELKDKQLSLAQMLSLVNFLISAGTPSDVKELKKQGISTAPDSKKKSAE